MQKSRLGSGLALCLLVSVAASCSSSDSGGGNGGPSDYAPPGNGVPMDEKDACQAVSQAVSSRKLALGCGPSTQAACPVFISAGHPACSQYDQGTVSACTDYYSKLSCDELKTKHCIVKALDGTAPNGCPVVDDAGSDAGEDAGEDAGPDAESDAASDSANDAPSADDAASD